MNRARITPFLRAIALVAGLGGSASVAQQATPPASPSAPAAPAEDMTRPSADASTAREVTLTARPVLMLRGQGNWDEGYETLMKAFGALRSEAARLGLKPMGKPQSAFTETSDQTFSYEAMLALEAPPPAGVQPGGGIAFATSPEGRAFVFSHTGAYDDIDSVYEAITAWLDEKGLTAKGSFIEEYLNEPQGADDALLQLNIYVFVQ
mgnify:CR=1 FL=1